MPRFQSRRPFPQRRTPNRTWAGFTTQAINVPAATKVLLGTFTLSNPGIDETILRVAGYLSVISDQLVATEQQIGSLGFVVVNDLAVAAGAASIPGPSSQIDDDGWFVFVPFTNNFQLASAASFNAIGSLNLEFGSKAKRRIEDGF